MRLFDIISLSFHNAVSGGFKTALCVISVAVGVLSLTAAITAGNIAKNTVGAEISEIGLHGGALYTKSGARLIMPQNITDRKTMPFCLKQTRIRFKKSPFSALVIGADGNLPDVWDVKLLYGRGFKKSDIESQNRVAIIDDELSKRVYKRENTVGKTVFATIDGQTVRLSVIGVIKSQKKGISSLIGTNVPEIVYVPSSLVSCDKVAISCASVQDGEKLAEKISRQTGESVLYKDLDVYADSFSEITDTVAYLTAGVAFIVLFVGGLGVCVNMTSETDRQKREIGVFIALGMRKKEVLLLFLFESLIICLLGGGAGCAFSALGAGLISEISIGECLKSAGKALLCAALCGTVFGIAPAVKASKRDPIKAIRNG